MRSPKSAGRGGILTDTGGCLLPRPRWGGVRVSGHMIDGEPLPRVFDRARDYV